jgi:predicted nicotinamide N-methyase
MTSSPVDEPPLRPLRPRFVALDERCTPVAGVVVFEAKDPGKAVDDAIKTGGPAPYGAVLWDSATDVARGLFSVELSGRRVLELGCGCGLVGVVCAIRGARVLCTDVDVHTLTATQRAATEANVVVDVALFDMTGAEPLPLIDGQPVTDVVIADVLYEPGLAASAARRTLEALALGARVIVGDPERAGRRDFLRLLTEAGHVVDFNADLGRGVFGTVCVVEPR